jgi:choline dehydrogenase-like flavoprotein
MAPKSMDAVDAVVIGSGAGGAPVALTLARAGARVVMLDKGPYYALRDFVHDEVAICLRDFWAPYPTEDPNTLVKGDETRARRTREGWTGVCVGGATVHMSGFTYRFKESDLKLATLTGGLADADLADWPISMEELTPYYDLVEVKMGVSGRAGANPFDHPRRPYPLPPLKPHPAAQLVDEAARGLGYHPFPTPRAILSRAYGNRPACNQCGFCGDYGCENASKSSVLATLIPEAEATGRCDIRPRAMVTRILVDAQGRASGVEYLDAAGELRRVTARAVVLAASAVQSARLWLLSGLPNGGGLVGKNLTFSTFGKVTAIFDRAELAARLGPKDMELPFLQRSIQDDYWMEKSGLALPKGGTYNFILHHVNPINAAIRLFKDSDNALWGQALKDRIHRYFHDELWMEVEIFGEFLPWRGAFVDLDPEVKDRWGLPAARIHLKHHPADVATNTAMVKRGMEIFRALRPAPKSVSAWTWGTTTFHLQHGTCRFGDDPSRSVLDRNCQSHEVKNLYVTDGSFMPTSGGVPATPTILANSFRVAEAIRARFLRRELG